jgi:hypothetical protein
MGATLKALGDTGTLLRHNPILWTGGTVLTIVFLVVYVVLNLIPLVGLLSVFVTPVFATGLLGMAYAGRNGNADLSAFVDGVTDNYLPYLASTLLLGAVGFVFAIVFGLVAFLTVGFGAMGAGAGRGAAAGLSAIIVLLLLGGFLIGGLVGLVIQFFDVAIVVDDAGPLSAFSKSFALVSSAPLSVLGYTVARTVLGGLLFTVPWVLFAVLGAGVSAMGGGPGASESLGIVLLAGLGLYGLVVLPLGVVVLATYHVAYFNRHKAAGAV